MRGLCCFWGWRICFHPTLIAPPNLPARLPLHIRFSMTLTSDCTHLKCTPIHPPAQVDVVSMLKSCGSFLLEPGIRRFSSGKIKLSLFHFSEVVVPGCRACVGPFAEQGGGFHFQHQQHHFRQLGVGLMSGIEVMECFGEGDAQVLVFFAGGIAVLH